MVVAGKESRREMEAADKSKKEGIVVMPTVVPDPPKVGVVEAAPGTGKENPPRNVGIVARKATGRVCVGRSTPIRRKPHPDPGGPNREIGSDRTTLRAPNDSEMEWAWPL